jgi:hypothetical protein
MNLSEQYLQSSPLVSGLGNTPSESGISRRSDPACGSVPDELPSVDSKEQVTVMHTGMGEQYFDESVAQSVFRFIRYGGCRGRCHGRGEG